MNGRSLVAVVAAALLTASCAYNLKVNTDYDQTISFTRYRTFAIREGSSAGNPLMEQRIRAAVQAALAAKGWAEAPDGEGDASVVTHTATETKRSIHTFYDGWGGWRWHWYGGASRTVVDEYEVGTLVVDIFDARTKQAIWRGVASSVTSETPDRNERNVQEAVTKMFRTFPPTE